MEDWGAVRARLRQLAVTLEPIEADRDVDSSSADIRAAGAGGAHDGQIDPLAKYIMSECPEYITGGGAVETAIRAIKALRQRVEELERDYAEVQDISVSESVGRRAAEAKLARCVEALEQIEALRPREFVFPSDWEDQIKVCPKCQHYKNHPIQQGICDTHRQPLWDRERHNSFEAKALGPRAHGLARAALAAAKGE